MNRLLLNLCFIVLVTLAMPLRSFAENPTERNDFFLISIPKSGTHMLTKLLIMLTDLKHRPVYTIGIAPAALNDQQFEDFMVNSKNSNQFAYGHTNPNAYSPFFMRFGEAHPEYVQIVQIRDLRDVIISYMHYVSDAIKQELGGNPSNDEMLTHMLNITESTASMSLERYVQYGITWANLPNIVLIHFEDLVGPKGKGSADAQKETILNLVSKLNISLSEEKLEYIVDNLFGNMSGPPSGTFRKGQIGEWQDYFKPNHMKLFNEKWGHYQTALNYPLCECVND